MHGCEILFSADDAAAIRRELGKAMGASSPCVGCTEGHRCPLLPDDLGPLLVQRTPVTLLPGVLNTRSHRDAGAEPTCYTGPRLPHP